MRKKTALLQMLLAIAITAMSAPLYAGSSTGQMNVSVQVIARTILTVDAQPSEINVTADDIARGYVDVPQAVAFRVQWFAADRADRDTRCKWCSHGVSLLSLS